MKNLFCSACGQRTLPTMRICPQCGGRNFSSSAQADPENIDPSPNQTTNQMSGTLNSDFDNSASIGNPAKHLPRLIAAIIDSVLSQGAVYVAALALSLFGAPQTPEAIFAIYFILGLIISTLYYSLQHSSKSQATVGKRLMGLKLITLKGERVSLGLSVLRIILPGIIFIAGTALFAIIATPMVLLAEGAPDLQAGAISAFVVIYLVLIFVPLLMVFGNAAHRTLYDIICNTRVIGA